jgi:hypothetical protein
LLNLTVTNQENLRLFRPKTVKALVLACIILFVIQVNLFAEHVFDKSAKVRPSWLKETPKGKDFDYYVGMATSNNSLDNAKDTAISDAISSLAMKNELVIEGTITTHEAEINSTLLSSVTKEIKLSGKSDKVRGLQKEEDYWEMSDNNKQTSYRYWVLMKIPKQPNLYNPNIPYKTSYGVVPVLKSVVVPGWGQIHKGETAKGILFLSSIAVTTTAGFITLNLSNGYKDDADNAHVADWVDYYNQMSDQYFYASLSSFIMAGAFYGYNIFDVISAKGAKIYADDNSHRLNICVLPNKKNTLCFSYKF